MLLDPVKFDEVCSKEWVQQNLGTGKNFGWRLETRQAPDTWKNFATSWKFFFLSQVLLWQSEQNLSSNPQTSDSTLMALKMYLALIDL